MDKNNIILIGFMGVGKGTVARAIYALNGSFCIDTDDVIESLTKTKIKDIFESKGEAHFRALEKDCASWLLKSINNTIISTGGGFYKQEQLKEIGTVVYLQSSFDEILYRINSSSNAQKKLQKRPLLQNQDDAKKLFNSRIDDYTKVADLIINVERKEPKEIASEIFSKLRK